MSVVVHPGLDALFVEYVPCHAHVIFDLFEVKAELPCLVSPVAFIDLAHARVVRVYDASYHPTVCVPLLKATLATAHLYHDGSVGERCENECCHVPAIPSIFLSLLFECYHACVYLLFVCAGHF